MATVKFISVPSKRLASSINASSTSFQLNNIKGWDGVNLTASDFGTKLYAVFRNDTNNLMELTEIDPATIASGSIDFIRRGLKFTGDLTTEVAANKLTWIKNETIVELGSNPPQLLEHIVRTIGDQIIAGKKTFSEVPAFSEDATDSNDGVRYSQLLAATFGTVNASPVVIPGNAGETVAIDQLVYFDVSDSEWYLADADTAAEVDNIILGITKGAGTNGNAITGGITLFGLHTFAGATLTANSTYYASNTAGGFSDTPGTTEVVVGASRNTSSLYFYPRYNQQLTENQQDALAGTSGTPSSSNKFVTADDVSSAAASGKIVRADGTALPSLDGSNLTLGLYSYTAGDDILQNDSVYMTAADTVNKMVPSTIGTPVVTTTAPTNGGSQKRSLRMPTNGVYMHFNGGYSATAAVLSAQKRTINAAETDFSNESVFNLYATGGGTRHYDVCSLGSDKFLAIFQCDTAGAAAGIRAVVATSSGTVGSAVVLESTGGLAEQVACAQVDTDKAALFYKKDSDGDLYVQIVTVSGTTITTNTPVLVKACSNTNLLVAADQLTTNEVVLVYQDGSSSTVAMFGRTISVSGTTPTVNTENTVEASGSSSGVKVGIKALSSTKALMMYSDGAGSVNDNARHLNISGTTITASSTLTLGAARSTDYYGITGVSTTRALVTVVTGSQIITYYLNTSATAPTQIASVTITTGSPIVSASVVKVAPYTYAISAGQVTVPFIAKLTPQTARIGIAQNNIASAASGVVMQRFIRQTLAGGSLTAASIYYIDDNGQPTTDSSLTAPQLGISASTTKILLT